MGFSGWGEFGHLYMLSLNISLSSRHHPCIRYVCRTLVMNLKNVRFFPIELFELHPFPYITLMIRIAFEYIFLVWKCVFKYMHIYIDLKHMLCSLIHYIHLIIRYPFINKELYNWFGPNDVEKVGLINMREVVSQVILSLFNKDPLWVLLDTLCHRLVDNYDLRHMFDASIAIAIRRLYTTRQ